MNATAELELVTPQETARPEPKKREPLPPKEHVELVRLEKIIAAGWKPIRECAGALSIIRDRRLYRARFDTFADYCSGKWGREKSAVNMMLQAYEVRKAFDQNLAKDDPAKTVLAEISDSAVRELCKVDPPARAEVLMLAAARNGNGAPTALEVREAVQPVTARRRNVRRRESSGGPASQRAGSGTNAGRGVPAAKAANDAHPCAGTPLCSASRMIPVAAVLRAFDATVDLNGAKWKTVKQAIKGMRKTLGAL